MWVEGNVKVSENYSVPKKPNGRKLGYKMQDWQKTLQNHSIQDKDLACFYRFLSDFIQAVQGFVGQKFYLEDGRDAKEEFCTMKSDEEDKIYTLEYFTQNKDSVTQNIFYFRNTAFRWKVVSLKGFDLYEMFRNRNLHPINKNSRLMMQAKFYAYVWDNKRIERKKQIVGWLQKEMKKVHPKAVDTVRGFLEETSPDTSSLKSYKTEVDENDAWKRVEECLKAFAMEGLDEDEA